jgi:hypothetical protein
MSDTEAKVVISGDGSGAVEAMRTAGDAVQSGAANIKSALNELGESFEKLTGLFATLTAVVAGGAFFKEAINDSNKLTGEVLKLSQAMGISTEEANALRGALNDISSNAISGTVDADAYISTFQRFAQQLRANEDGIKQLGVATRDANGHLREANEVFTEALKVVGDYKPGLDQTAAAQRLFGRSVQDVMVLQRLSNEVLEEAKKKNEDLNLTITQQNVEAAGAYKAAMNDVGDVLEGVMKTVGDAVMPVFTELARYLASTGPYVIAVFKGALTGLMLAFRAIAAVVKTVAAVIFEWFNSMMDQFGNLSKLFDDVMHGRWRKAADDVVAMKDRMVQSFVNIKDAAVDNFKEAGAAYANDLGNLWGPKEAAKSAAGGGKKKMGALGNSTAKEEDHAAIYEAQLSEMKAMYAQENGMREMSKQEELQYWQDVLDFAAISSNDRLNIEKRVADTKLAIMKELRQTEDQLEQERIAQAQKMAGLAIDAKRQEVDAKVAMGIMSAQDQLKEEAKLEEERFRITKAGIEARLAILAKDPTKNVVALRKLNDELDAEEMTHMNKVRAIEIKDNQETLKDYQQLFAKIGNSFATTMQQLMTHQKTWSQAVKSMYQEGLSAVASYLAQYLQKKLAAFVVEKGINMAGIAGDSAKAGSGAASAMANIPYVGPILAIAAMAAVFAATMGMQSNVKSARGGYDIPSGMNPMVQTHEEEMILPKEQANAVRDMAEGGAGGLTINATPMPGGFWMMHQNELLKVVGNGNKYRRG